MTTVLLFNLAFTWALVGLIWFVQMVHYPLFAAVDGDSFPSYESQHTKRTGWLVGLMMPIEALTAAWLLVEPPAGVDPVWPLLGMALVGLIWVTTLAVHVPLHRRLSVRFEAALVRRLVVSNWIRTLLWTARGLLILGIVGSLLG